MTTHTFNANGVAVLKPRPTRAVDIGTKRLLRRLIELRARILETCPTCGRTLDASCLGLFAHIHTPCLRITS